MPQRHDGSGQRGALELGAQSFLLMGLTRYFRPFRPFTRKTWPAQGADSPHPFERGRTMNAQGLPITTTIRHFTELSGIGRSKTYEMLDAGQLDSVHVGTRRLIVV